MSARFAAGAEAISFPKAGRLFSQSLDGVAGSGVAAGRVETGGIARALSQTAPVDQAKVAALKAAVQMSSYAIEPGKVADAMIASLRGQ